MRAQLPALWAAFGRHSLRMAAPRSRIDWLLALLLGGGVLMMSSFFYMLTYAAFRLADPVHYPSLMGALLAAGQGIALIFGFFYLLSAFFYSRDLPLLNALPIRPWTIAANKFGWVLVGEWLSLAPLLGPGLVAYAVAAGPPAGYWLAVFWTYLWLPVLPLALDGLVLLVLLRVADLGRSRELLRVAGALLGLGLAVGLQLWLRSGLHYGADGIEELARQVLAGDMPQPVAQMAAPAIWLAHAVLGGEWSVLLLQSVAGAGGLLLLLWAAEHHLLPSAMSGIESRRRSAGLTARQQSDFHRVRRPWWALMLQDLRLLLRTPVFFVNSALSLVLVPFLLALPVLLTPTEVLKLQELFLGTEAAAWAPLAVIATATLATATSSLGSTAISREGPRLWQSAILPVRPAQHVQTKLGLAAAGGMISALAALGLLLAVGGVGPGGMILALLGSALGGWAAGAAGLWVDLLRPRLDWVDPQQAMKGNTNNLLGLLATLACLVPAGLASGVAGILAAALGGSAPAAALATFLGALAFCGLAGYLWAVYLARGLYGGRRTG